MRLKLRLYAIHADYIDYDGVDERWASSARASYIEQDADA